MLNPSDFAGDDRPECLENTRKETLDSIYQWVSKRTFIDRSGGYWEKYYCDDGGRGISETRATWLSHVLCARKESSKDCPSNYCLLSGCVQPIYSRVSRREVEEKR